MHNGILYLAGESLKELMLPIIGSELIVNLIMTLICIVIIFLLVALSALVFTLWERKVCAWIQVRIGPNRVGPGGILQSVADMIKLLDKEDIIPVGIDRWLWVLSPILIFIPAAMVYALYPFDDGVIFADVNIGLFLLIAISSQSVLPFLMGGYASNSKYSMLGGMRTVAQMLAYEVPMVISLMGIIMITGSLKMSAIVEAQSEVWFIFLQPLAFLIYMTTSLVESNRAPFNMVEGESEIIAGPFTEYTGMRWALFFLAEFANLLSIGIMTSVLFLGGWQGPDFLPTQLWFWIKAFLMVMVYQWIGWTFPRTRMDTILTFGWKVMLPLSLINLLLTGVGIYIYRWL